MSVRYMRSLYMMRRQFLIMSVSSMPRAWLFAYYCWLPEGESTILSMVSHTGPLLLFYLVAPQLLIVYVLVEDRRSVNGSNLSFVVDSESLGGNLCCGELFFENLAIVYIILLYLGNFVSYLKQGARVYKAARRANTTRIRQGLIPLRPLCMVGHWTFAQVRPIAALELLDFFRIYSCALLLTWLANIPYLGKFVSRLSYRSVLWLKLCIAFTSAFPQRIFALFRPIGWRRIIRLPADVLSDELDELERTWLPVVALLSRSAAFRRRRRFLLQMQRGVLQHQQPPSDHPTHLIDHRNMFEAQAAALGDQQQQENFAFMMPQPHTQRRTQTRAINTSRPLTWPSKLPMAPEPPLTDDELDELSRDAPSHLVCPISLRLLLEPCVSVSGTTYDRRELERAVLHNARDPLTFAPCLITDLRPNYAVRQVIQDYIVDSRRQRKEQSLVVNSSPQIIDENNSEADFRILLPQQNMHNDSTQLTVRNLVRCLSRLTPQDVYTANKHIAAADEPLEPGLFISFRNLDSQIEDDDDADKPQESTADVRSRRTQSIVQHGNQGQQAPPSGIRRRRHKKRKASLSPRSTTKRIRQGQRRLSSGVSLTSSR